jgi:hypothetical protein
MPYKMKNLLLYGTGRRYFLLNDNMGLEWFSTIGQG